MAKVTNITDCDRVWRGIDFPAGKAVEVEDGNLCAQLKQIRRAFKVEDAPTKRPPGRPKGSKNKPKPEAPAEPAAEDAVSDAG